MIALRTDLRVAGFLAASAAILVACVLAASIPARRAARIDPIGALRHE